MHECTNSQALVTSVDWFSETQLQDNQPNCIHRLS